MTVSRGHWVLDKKIPIASILGFALAILIQTVAIAWWASGVSNRVANVETHSLQVDANLAKMAADATSDRDRILAQAAEANVRTARLEERYAAIDDVLKRLDDKMDKLIDTQRPARAR